VTTSTSALLSKLVPNMSFGSPLDDWRFLVGEWKGKSKDEFGEKGIIESLAIFSMEPGEKFIMGRHEGWCEGRLLNKSITLLFFDKSEGKFKRKSFFSYGFVNHEVEYARSSDEIRFDVQVEPLPKEFEGIRWRSYLRKISEKKIAMGLEMAKGEKEFKRYGETILVKTS